MGSEMCIRDRSRDMGGVFMAQVLPFVDPKTLQAFYDFETAAYQTTSGRRTGGRSSPSAFSRGSGWPTRGASREDEQQIEALVEQGIQFSPCQTEFVV